MDEAQERNIIQFVRQNSTEMDVMWSNYLDYCKKNKRVVESKEHLEDCLRKKGYQIIAVEGKRYALGAFMKGEKRSTNAPYFKSNPVPNDVFLKWLDDHGWVS